MGWKFINGIPIGGGGTSLSSYWTPSNAVVENADATKIILTYSKKIQSAPDKSLIGVISNLVAGYTVSSASLDATQKILTVNLASSMYADESATITINSGSQLFSCSITNNIAREAEYTAVYNAMPTKPSSGLSSAYNKFIKDRKASGVWAKTDKFLFFGTPLTTQAVINWKNPGTLDPTLSSTPPTFEAYRGYLGVPASSTAINTKFNPVRDGVNFTQNSAGVGCYILNNKAAAAQTTIGACRYTPGDEWIQLDTKISSSGNKAEVAINSAAAAIDYSIVNNDAYGFYHLNRTSATAIALFKDDTKNSLTKNSVSPLVNYEIPALARGLNGVNDRFSSDKIVALWYTSGLLDADVADLKAGLLSLLNYRDNRPNIKGLKAYYFGDSITAGYDSVDTNADWCTLLTTETGTTKVNNGVSSMSLLTGHNPNFASIYEEQIPIYNATTDGLLSFAFGVNDLYTNTYSNVNDFISFYLTVINYAINTKGWPKSKIMIITNSLTFTDGSALATAIQSMCTTNEFNCYNPLVYMNEHGGIGLTFDNVHPSDAGYLVYYQGLMRDFKKWFIY